MKDHKQITKKELIYSIIFCTLFLFVYWVLFYELNILCKFGKIKNSIPILIGCIAFFIIWIIMLVIKIIKKTSVSLSVPLDENANSSEFYSKFKIKYIFIVVLCAFAITCFYGAKIYHSAVNYNGKLSWFLKDLKDKRTVKFEHNNIYQDGIEGIFTDINKKVHLPKKLYMSNNFSLKFNANGKITSFDTFLYGKNDKGNLESFLISYDINKSDTILIYLNGYAKANYNNDKLLDPLIKTMKAIPLKQTISKWNENQYGILYSGKRNFGYNTSGIVYINSKGKINSQVNAYYQIIGYTVSVYVPGKENIDIPVRYILKDNLYKEQTIEPSPKNNSQLFDESYDSSNQFYLSKKIGYRLEITGAAAGTRSYSLNKTTDRGQTWKTINEDPFSGATGTASGITFLNDKLGFLCLSYSGGRNGQLYRTEDGGISYQKISFPEIKVPLANSGTYNPFDLPGMPYKQNGILNILVGQGSDGDYNNGCKALYQSKDDGKTWVYVKQVPKDFK